VAALVLVLLALAIVKAARIRMPVYRHMIWLYCLMGIIGLPLIWLHGPKLTLAILPASAQTYAAPTLSGAGAEVEETSPGTELTPAGPLTVETSSGRPEHMVSWKTAAVAAWLLGFSILLTRLAVGWVRLRHICRLALPLQTSEYPVEFAGPGVRLYLTSELEGPVCFGVFHPIVVLPEDIYHAGSPEDLRMVLTHELAHIERGDCWANLFQRLVEAIYFFHPLVWLASRQLTQEREEICDNHVLAEGASADDYTTLLSHLGAQSVHASYLQTVALFEGQLLSRIRSLLDPSRNRQTKLPWRVAAVCTVAVLAGFLVLGSVRLAAQPSDRATGSSPGSPGSSSTATEQRPAQSSAVASEKPVQPRYAPRIFNSKAAFFVFFQETADDSRRAI
jgi:beta-lactamase regulating signal transducer with metallopeptidase domain